MKFIYKSLFYLSFFLILSCASQKATISNYVDPALSSELINSIAVFPMRNARFAPNEAREINQRFAITIHTRNPEIKIFTDDKIVEILNDQNLSDEWSTFIDNYISSGVIDANVLSQIGNALSVDAIIQSEIDNIFQMDGSIGENTGTTKVTIRYFMMSVRSGKMLWEASSEGVAKTATTLEEAPSIIDAVNVALSKIIEKLPFFNKT